MDILFNIRIVFFQELYIPLVLQVFLSLYFDEDLGKKESSEVDKKTNAKFSKKRKNFEEPNKLPDNEKKRSKKEIMLKTREEVHILT